MTRNGMNHIAALLDAITLFWVTMMLGGLVITSELPMFAVISAIITFLTARFVTAYAKEMTEN